jgi:hypothetical protein
MATRKKIQLEEVSSLPDIVKGSHLTVITYSNGKTELEWDWDALVNEVREACASVETKSKTKTKKSVVKTK